MRILRELDSDIEIVNDPIDDGGLSNTPDDADTD
jgi:hypothetical protein